MKTKPALRHRDRSVCRRCKRTRRIENVRLVQCAECIGKRTLPVRYAKLRSRFTFTDDGRRAFFDAVDHVERSAGLTAASSGRTRAMGHLLNAALPIASAPTWLDVHELRAVLDRLTPGTRHQASWALHRACDGLVATGVLESRSPKCAGSAAEQIEVVLEYFVTRDESKRRLLRRLADFYLRGRPTITAVQVVQAFAYYLSRSTVPLDTSAGLAAAKQAVSQRGGRWTRRILTALVRVGEVLEADGDLPRREDPRSAEVIARRLITAGPERIVSINRRFLTDLERRGRRPNTLRSYALELARLWDWLVGAGTSDPSQVTSDTWRRYVVHRRRSGVAAGSIEATRQRLRCYFMWLRRERLTLHVPVPGLLPTAPVHVRICDPRDFRALVAAIVRGHISSEPALLLYLVMFHAFRNFELTRVRAIGYVARQFHLTVEPVPGVGDTPRSAGRPSLVILPTAKYRWLGKLLDDVLDARARRIKDSANPYLFVSGSWRNTRAPMNANNFARTIRMVTKRVCGRPISANLLRVTAGTMAADAGDLTVCRFLGWAAQHSMKLAYNPREVMPRASQDTFSKRKLLPPSYTPTVGMRRA